MGENRTDNIKIENIDEYIEKQVELKINNLLKTLPEKPLEGSNIKPIYEYTVGELYKNTLQNTIDIINDLVDAYSNRNYITASNFTDTLFAILLKDNRKIYVGIILILLSFIIYFIDGVSV